MARSPIETFPPELLQEIFILTELNLALPESSPYISSKLSNPYIYRLVCNRYFDPRYHTRLYGSSVRPFQVQRDQARIFTYKWMTWEIYKSFLSQKYGQSGCLCDQTPETGCPSPQWPPDFEHPTNMVFEGLHKPALLSLRCAIPAKLVRGPWTLDKVQFLRFLLWTTSMNTDWRSPEACGNTRRGRREAVLEKSLDAVQLLNNCRRVCRAPKLDDVRFAVIEGGCDRSIVYDTMQAVRMWGVIGTGWDCEILDRWCASAVEAGNPKGQWLKLKLQELRMAEPSNVTKIPPAKLGGMFPRTGDYDHVEDDKLVIVQKKWNGPWPRLSDVLELRGHGW
jgi:hypothetical protein